MGFRVGFGSGRASPIFYPNLLKCVAKCVLFANIYFFHFDPVGPNFFESFGPNFLTPLSKLFFTLTKMNHPNFAPVSTHPATDLIPSINPLTCPTALRNTLAKWMGAHLKLFLGLSNRYSSTMLQSPKKVFQGFFWNKNDLFFEESDSDDDIVSYVCTEKEILLTDLFYQLFFST